MSRWRTSSAGALPTLVWKSLLLKARSPLWFALELLLPVLAIVLLGLAKDQIYGMADMAADEIELYTTGLTASTALSYTLTRGVVKPGTFAAPFAFVGSDESWEAFSSFLTSELIPAPPQPLTAANLTRFASYAELMAAFTEPVCEGCTEVRARIHLAVVERVVEVTRNRVVETTRGSMGNRAAAETLVEHTEDAAASAGAAATADNAEDEVKYVWEFYQHYSTSYRLVDMEPFNMINRNAQYYGVNSFTYVGPFALLEGLRARVLRKHGAVALPDPDGPVTLQAVSDAFVYALGGAPAPQGRANSHLRRGDSLLAIGASVAFVVPFLALLSAVVAERETLMCEMLRITGIGLSAVVLSWAAVYGLLLAGTALCVTLVAKVAVFPNVAFSVLYVPLLAACANIIALALLFSLFFSSARLAQLTGALVFALSWAFYSAVKSSLPAPADDLCSSGITALAGSAFGPSGLTSALAWVAYRSRVAGGGGAVPWRSVGSCSEGYSLQAVCVALVAGAVVCFAAAAYAYAVVGALQGDVFRLAALCAPFRSCCCCGDEGDRDSDGGDDDGGGPSDRAQRTRRRRGARHGAASASASACAGSCDAGVTLDASVMTTAAAAAVLAGDDSAGAGDSNATAGAEDVGVDVYALPARYHPCARIEASETKQPQQTQDTDAEYGNGDGEKEDEDDDDEIVRIRNLRKEYPSSNLVAVKRLNLDIHRGELFALLGHNGAGKSTVLNILSGLCKPTAGGARIDGVDLRDCHRTVAPTASLKQYFQHQHQNSSSDGGASGLLLRTNGPSIGVCPQHDILYPSLTPRDHLELFARLRGVPRAVRIAEVNRWLRALNLLDRGDAYGRLRGRVIADAPVSTLSGGQRRCVSLGIALIGDPKLVILDEPTAGLDVAAQASVRALLQEQRRHRAILLTTHSMEEAEICDRIGILANGSLQTVGSSLFLKRTFGAGYTLSVTKAPEESLLETATRGKRAVAAAAAALAALEPTAEELAVEEATRVRLSPAGRRIARALARAIPELVTMSDLGPEMSFAVPTAAVPRLPDLLNTVERDKAALGVASFAVSVTPLSDVFFTVANAAVVDDDSPDAVVTIPSVPLVHAAPASQQWGEDDTERATSAMGTSASAAASLDGTDFFGTTERNLSHTAHVRDCVTTDTEGTESAPCEQLSAAPSSTSAHSFSSVTRRRDWNAPHALPGAAADSVVARSVRVNTAGSGKIDNGADINGFYEKDDDLWQDDFAQRRLYGRSVFCSILGALYCKRAIVARREGVAILVQTLAPVVALGACLIALWLASVPMTQSDPMKPYSHSVFDSLPYPPWLAVPQLFDAPASVADFHSDMMRYNGISAQDVGGPDMLPMERCADPFLYKDLLDGYIRVRPETQFFYGLAEVCVADNLYPTAAGNHLTARDNGPVSRTAEVNNTNDDDDDDSILSLKASNTTRFESLILLNGSTVDALPIIIVGTTNVLLAAAYERAAAQEPPHANLPPKASIEVSFTIVDAPQSWNIFSTRSAVALFGSGVVIFIGILTSTFGHIIVLERTNFSKHLQLVSGASSAVYWLAHALWDATLAALLFVFLLIIDAVLKMKLFTTFVILAYWLFFMMVIPFSYCVAMFSGTPARCQTILASCHVFGIFTSLVAIATSSIPSSPNYVSFNYVFINAALIPLGGLITTLVSSLDSEKWPYDYRLALVSTAGGALLFTALLVLLESHARQGLRDWVTCSAPPASLRNPARSEWPAREDPDVAAEREAVLNGERENAMYYPVVCYGLRKVFPPRRFPPAPAHVAVSDLHFAVAKGECFGLLGSNGAGKTSVLQMLTGGMLPTSGAATVSGFDIQVRYYRLLWLLTKAILAGGSKFTAL